MYFWEKFTGSDKLSNKLQIGCFKRGTDRPEHINMMSLRSLINLNLKILF